MNNRWLILIAGCLIQTVLGGIYAWSTFSPHLAQDHGLSNGQSSFIFGATILVFTAAMIPAGRILVKKGPRFTASISAILFMLGYLIASYSGGSFLLLLLGIGVVAGCGIGFGYVCPLTVGIKWFPERKGLVSGIAVAGFGAGAILLTTIAKYYIPHTLDILTFFRYFGIVAGLILLLSAFILKNPSGITPQMTQAANTSMVLAWPFQLTMIGIFTGTFAGLLIISNLTSLVMKAGLSAQHAAWAVIAFAVGNALGRVIWGKLFDHITYKCIPLSLFSFALISATLLIPMGSWMLLMAVMMVAFCFGANFVLYASAISKFFGSEAFPKLYPICFLAYGVAGIIGPALGGYIADKTGSFGIPVYLCISILMLGALITYLKLPVFGPQQQSSNTKVKPSLT